MNKHVDGLNEKVDKCAREGKKNNECVSRQKWVSVKKVRVW